MLVGCRYHPRGTPRSVKNGIAPTVALAFTTVRVSQAKARQELNVRNFRCWNRRGFSGWHHILSVALCPASCSWLRVLHRGTARREIRGGAQHCRTGAQRDPEFVVRVRVFDSLRGARGRGKSFGRDALALEIRTRACGWLLDRLVRTCHDGRDQDPRNDA